MQPTFEKVPGDAGIMLELARWSHDGVGLLLLHGFDNDLHVWDEFAPALAPYYQTLALDHRGHGESEWDREARYDPETMTRDVESVLDHLGIERVVLVGHSLGGRIALRFAGEHPERVAGLVVVDVGPELDARGTTRIRLDIRNSKTSYASTSEFEAVLARRYPETDRETIGRMAEHWVRRNDAGEFVPKTDPAFGTRRADLSEEQLRAWSEHETRFLWKALEQLPCPLLVIRGAASDVFDPDVAERMAEEVAPNGKLEVISQAGHSVMLDNPPAFLNALTSFVLGEDA